jgi:hypothetical protein
MQLATWLEGVPVMDTRCHGADGPHVPTGGHGRFYRQGGADFLGIHIQDKLHLSAEENGRAGRIGYQARVTVSTDEDVV